MTAAPTSVCIAGAGLAGCAIAYCLSRAGVPVTVLERDQVGAHASSAAAGMLAPLAESRGRSPFLELALASLDLFDALVTDLRRETGIDVEYSACGVLRVAETETVAARLRGFYTWQREAGFPTEWLDPAAARALEPGLSPEIAGAIYSPTEKHVQSPRLTQALAQAAERRGAIFRTGAPVTGFRSEGSRILAARTPQGEVEAAHFVLATGAWTAICAAWLGVSLPIFPVRGQILALTQIQPPLQRIVFGSHIYFVPKLDGSLVVGATEEHAGFDVRVTAGGLAQLLTAATSLLPAAGEAAFLRAWAGLRPGSGDGHPLLGPLPGWDNVTIAAGHFRNGVLLSAITGKAIAELLTQGRASVNLERFAPGRFFKD